MIEYIYFVKCPNCEDEPFNFFNEAKEFALGCLGSKPIITQVEVNRNDFGECTDSCDLGTIWSWEDVMSDVSADEPAVSVFTQGDFAKYNPDNDPEFTALDNTLDYVPDNFRRPSSTKYESLSEQPKTWICWYEGSDIGTVEASTKEEAEEAMMNQFPEYQYNNTDWGVEEAVSEVCHKKSIPAGMTIESLVEEMEENEDTVECKWCNELFDKSEVRYEVDLGYLCSQCEAGIKSRGETLTFKESFDDASAEDTIEETELQESDTAFNRSEKVEFYYDDLKYEYITDKDYVIDTLVDIVTDKDVADLSGGRFKTVDEISDYDTLNYVEHGTPLTQEWTAFLENNYDELFSRHEEEVKEALKDKAEEAMEEEQEKAFWEANNDEGYGDGAFASEDAFWRWKEGDDYARRYNNH